MADGGMASFKDLLSKDDVTAIHAYVLSQAHALWEAKKGKAKSELEGVGLLVIAGESTRAAPPPRCSRASEL